MKTDPTSVALGKKLGVVEDPRTLRLARLLEPSDLPTAPKTWRYAKALHSVPMFANDRYGCCTFASHGHRVVAQEFSTQQREAKLTDDDILAGYAAVTGFRRDRPNTDRGAYMLDVANYMRRTGIGKEKDGSRHTIEAFVKVNHASMPEVRTACSIFGGIWVGVWLPNSAQGQDIWDVPAGGATGAGEPGSWGGHAIEGVGYDPKYVTVYTWGREQRMTWAFWNTYVDEAYALISEDWLRANQTTSRGFKVEQLRAWLAELG